jgi:hypothetical protein
VPEVQLPGLAGGNAGDQEQEQGGKNEKESHRESATGDEWESSSMYKYSSMRCLSFYTVRPVAAPLFSVAKSEKIILVKKLVKIFQNNLSLGP